MGMAELRIPLPTVRSMSIDTRARELSLDILLKAVLATCGSRSRVSCAVPALLAADADGTAGR